MGNTSLDIKAFSELLHQKQLHHKPVYTFQSIPRRERDEAMLQKDEKEEEEENGRK